MQNLSNVGQSSFMPRLSDAHYYSPVIGTPVVDASSPYHNTHDFGSYNTYNTSNTSPASQQHAFPISGPPSVDEISFPSFVAKTYKWMSAGLLTTAATAFIIANSPLLFSAATSYWGLALTIGVIFVLACKIEALRKYSPIDKDALQAQFLLQSCAFGSLLSATFVVYSPSVILLSFVVTGVAFLALGAEGLSNPDDLSKYKPAVAFGLISLALLSFSAILGHLAVMEVVIAALSVVLFSAWILIKHNQLEKAYVEARPDQHEAVALREAIDLYMSFLNLFMEVLKIAGKGRKERTA